MEHVYPPNVSTPSIVEQCKQDEHFVPCRPFDFISFCFSTFKSFSRAAEDLLSNISQRYSSHAAIHEWEAHVKLFRRPPLLLCVGLLSGLWAGRQRTSVGELQLLVGCIHLSLLYGQDALALRIVIEIY